MSIFLLLHRTFFFFFAACLLFLFFCEPWLKSSFNSGHEDVISIFNQSGPRRSQKARLPDHKTEKA